MLDAVKVAEYILNECGVLSTMKLQKLVYYSQAFHLAKFNKQLFNNRIEAWVNGPVIPDLFQKHKGCFVVSEGFFGQSKIDELNGSEYEAINHVVNCLKSQSGAELSNLTHAEKPWINARVGFGPSEPCSEEITPEAMKLFYSNYSDNLNPAFL